MKDRFVSLVISFCYLGIAAGIVCAVLNILVLFGVIK